VLNRSSLSFRELNRSELDHVYGRSLHWFESSAHFPQWDAPQETTRLILAATRGDGVASAARFHNRESKGNIDGTEAQST
jgi:hypothetical protein